MKKSTEIQYCTDLLNRLGKDERQKLLASSNLNTREINILNYRFIEGLTMQEIADKINLSLNGYYKAQRKILLKLYQYIKK